MASSVAVLAARVGLLLLLLYSTIYVSCSKDGFRVVDIGTGGLGDNMVTGTQDNETAVIAFTLGTFDLFHRGHVHLLDAIAAQSDKLIVGLHTDNFVKKQTGGKLPWISQSVRFKLLKDFFTAMFDEDKNGTLRVKEVVVDPIDLHSKALKKYAFTHIFHGDAWSQQEQKDKVGQTMLKDVVQIVELPHIPDVSATALKTRAVQSGIVWLNVRSWNQNKEKFGNLSNIVYLDHLAPLYERLGGVWLVDPKERADVVHRFPDAPCIIVEPKEFTFKVHHLVAEGFKTFVSVKRDDLLQVGRALSVPNLPKEVKNSTFHVVLLSHGRHGKYPYGIAQRTLDQAVMGGGPLINTEMKNITYKIQDFNVYLHNWYDSCCYTHLSTFLSKPKHKNPAGVVVGGKFINPVPFKLVKGNKAKPIVLLLPTWEGGMFDSFDRKGNAIDGLRWLQALKDLAERADIRISPHPKLLSGPNKDNLQAVLDEVPTVQLLKAEGRSYEHVPKAHCVIADVGGAMWEALLFDTPVVVIGDFLKELEKSLIVPTPEEFRSVVPIVTPENVVEEVMKQSGQRKPQQNSLAEMALGKIDGTTLGSVVANLQRLTIEEMTKESNNTNSSNGSGGDSSNFFIKDSIITDDRDIITAMSL